MMSPRILHLRSSGGLYGAEQVILNLARELNELGCTNQIACFNNAHNPHLELVEEAEKANLTALSIDCRGLFDRRTVDALRKIVSSGGFDVIHCHDYKACAFGLSATIGQKVKRVATNHLWTHSGIRVRLYELIEALLYNAFDTIVAVSDLIEKETRPFLLRKDTLTCIPNGIDLHRFAFEKRQEQRRETRAELGLAESDLVVGNIARLSPEKDHTTLLHAFKMLTDRPGSTSVKLLVAGDGPEKDPLMSMARELGISERCRFTGVRRDIPQILNCLDVYVQSSKREGLPMVVLEAMASSLAIVSTKAGGVPAVITHGEQGRLVEIGATGQLAREIDDLLSHPDERERLGRQARFAGEARFSARAMAERYLEVYRRLTR